MGLSAVFNIARIGHSWWTYRALEATGGRQKQKTPEEEVARQP